MTPFLGYLEREVVILLRQPEKKTVESKLTTNNRQGNKSL